MEDVSGKVAFITGGGSGICLTFVQLLVQKGCKVLIADLTLHKQAQEWIASLPEALKTSVHFHTTDVSQWTQLAKALDVCESQFGSVPDIVVPGAGIYEPSSNTFWADSDDMETSRYKILDVNLVHPIKLTRMAIRKMLAANKSHGVIIHLSSVAGQSASVAMPLYAASKHGINSFVRGMAPLQEMVGIRVVAVAPGPVSTPLFNDRPEAMKHIDTNVSLLPPDEIARGMFALLTDGKYKAGTVLEVCDVEGRWREVNLLNDPGPSGPSLAAYRRGEAIEEVKEILNAERGAGPS